MLIVTKLKMLWKINNGNNLNENNDKNNFSGSSSNKNENVYNEYKNKVSKIFFKQYGLAHKQCNEIENIIETPLEECDKFLNVIKKDFDWYII